MAFGLCKFGAEPCSCRLNSDSFYVRHAESAFTDFRKVPFSFRSPGLIKSAWGASRWASGAWKRDPREASRGG